MSLAAWLKAAFSEPRAVRRDGRPRVLLLVASLPSDMVGGMQVQAERMASELGGAFDVVVLSRAIRVAAGLEQRPNYRVLRRPVLGVPRARAVLDGVLCLWQAAVLGRGSVCIVGYQTLISGLVAVLAGRLVGVPCLVSIRVDSEYNTNLRNPLVRLLSRLTWLLADRVLVQSPRAAAQFGDTLRNLRLPARITARIGVVPNGIDVLPEATSPRQALVFVGRLHPDKGLEVLLDALSRIPTPERPPLVVVGDGPLRRDLERRGRGMRVDFVGETSRDRALDCIRTALALVYPASSDGMSNAVMEAMAMGVPVIATRVAGLPDLIEDGHTGLLVTPGDTDALQHAIQRVVADAGLRTRIGAAGRRAIATHSWTRSRRDLEQQIELACAQRRSA